MLKLLVGLLNCKVFHTHTLQIEKEMKCKINGIDNVHVFYACKYCSYRDEVKGELKNIYVSYW